MRKLSLLKFEVILFFIDAFAQNVGISKDGSTPDPSAMLDVKSMAKALLIPG